MKAGKSMARAPVRQWISAPPAAGSTAGAGESGPQEPLVPGFPLSSASQAFMRRAISASKPSAVGS
jgi:hypothetical protein